jgi:hypothetical protein
MSPLELFLPARSNKPIARRANDHHQRKYPIPRFDTQPLGLSRTYQCALNRKAAAATHEDARWSARLPRNTTHDEATKKKIVVTALSAARTSNHDHGPPPQIALDAVTKASQPGIGGSIAPPPTPLTTGRNHAAPLSSHAPEIRRYGLLMLISLRVTILIRHKYMRKLPQRLGTYLHWLPAICRCLISAFTESRPANSFPDQFCSNVQQ